MPAGVNTLRTVPPQLLAWLCVVSPESVIDCQTSNSSSHLSQRYRSEAGRDEEE